jgi:hypothetical protein
MNSTQVHDRLYQSMNQTTTTKISKTIPEQPTYKPEITKKGQKLKREGKIDDRLTTDAIRIKARKDNAEKESIRQMQIPKEEKFTQISNKN